MCGMAEFHAYLPQLRIEGSVYFITWRLNYQADRLSFAERRIAAETLELFNEQCYRLAGYVVMDDHVHLVLQTLPGHDLSKVLHSLKSYTATMINKARGVEGKLWQKDSYMELLGEQVAVDSRIKYVYENPQRRWGGESADYEWVESFR